MKTRYLRGATLVITLNFLSGAVNAAYIRLPAVCSPAPKILFDEALEHFRNRHVTAALMALDAAEAMGHDADECAAYRWTCHMLLGDFPAAWRQSDQIRARGADGPLALWDGRDFDGKRVVIRCLHGYGDAIQFLRYAPLVARTAASVTVETHPEMVSLVSLMPGIDRVITWNDATGHDEWDQQIEVTELPWVFRTDLADIPNAIPYVSVCPRACERSLGAPGKPRIGVLWASSTWNPERSIPLIELEPVLSDDRFSFYSFQRGPERDQLEEIGRRYRIHDTSVHSPAISDTAADLRNMDLLITVDTMAAHLAGALGKPVWLMLPFEADWRWMLDRDDSPWYPAMRLFRQERQGDWRPVIERIVQELALF